MPAVDYLEADPDAFLASGFIGLQVHGVGGSTTPKEVRFRDLVLQVIDQPIQLAGDVDNDGSTDAADYTILRDNFGAASAVPSQGDLDNDGRVTAEDYAIWRQNYGASSLQSIVAVPEPATLGWVAWGLLSLALPQRVRQRCFRSEAGQHAAVLRSA